MKQLLIAGFIAALTLSGFACTFTVEGLSPSTQVYALEKEFTDLYAPPIKRYADQDFCDDTAVPPVLIECADAETVIILNDVVQEFGTAIKLAREAVKDTSEACKLAPESAACTDLGQTLSLAVTAARSVLTRVVAEFTKAGLEAHV